MWRRDTLDLGDLALEAGEVLPAARLVYGVQGRLNAAGDNCVLLPTYYGGDHESYTPLIGAGRALDPERWFIVSPNMFGNGVSTSPSNVDWVSEARPFPAISLADNVRAQRRLLHALGVDRLRLAAGWSMGAMQSFAWGRLYPDLVETCFGWCGSVLCWPLNAVFLKGLVAVLAADPAYRPGGGQRPEGVLRAFGRSYAGWAYSAQFYRTEAWRALGFDTLESFLRSWEDDHLAFDPQDLLAMIRTWLSGAPDHLPGAEDPAAALGRIRARLVTMPCSTDAYFTEAEARIEAEMIRGAEVWLLSSPNGHAAGAPGRFADDTGQVEAALRRLLV